MLTTRTYRGNQYNNYKKAEILTTGDEPLDLVWKMYGEGGNDTLIGANFNDSIYGGTGNDSLSGSLGSDRIYGESGNDRLFGEVGNDSLYGSSGDDYLSGGSGDDYLAAGSGDDILLSGSGNDRIYGNSGDDYLAAESGDDYLSGGSGTDNLIGGDGRDLLIGYGYTDSEYDVLTGNGVTQTDNQADTFVLGATFYTGPNENFSSVFYQGLGYASITDFSSLEGDKLRVVGSQSDYSLTIFDRNTVIAYQGDWIAIAENNTDLSLERDFEFLG